MEMDEEMDYFVEEFSETADIDLDYEFDAVQFYDFSRLESISEALEAERWFESAGSYPPSPFALKFRVAASIQTANASSSFSLEDGRCAKMNIGKSQTENSKGAFPSKKKDEGVIDDSHKAQNILRTKTTPKSHSSKARKSTLMKPTACHLAKQIRTQDANSGNFSGRSQKPEVKANERTLQNPPGFDNLASKRQKLEYGYLCKVAHLRHQALLSHKMSQKDVQLVPKSTPSKLKVTVPREPDLETEHRAKIRRYKNSLSDEHPRPKIQLFKARPLNRKILEPPNLALPKKSKPQLPEFQVFHLKTMERAMQHCSSYSSSTVASSINSDYMVQKSRPYFERSNSQDSMMQEKLERPTKTEGSSVSEKNVRIRDDSSMCRIVGEQPTEPACSTARNLPEYPPIELFNKLTLRSESQNNVVTDSKFLQPLKGSKENAPHSFQLELRRCAGKPNQCRSGRDLVEIGSHSNLSRSMGIR